MATVSAASNFYFFYMIALLAVGYAIIRLAVLYERDYRQAFRKLLVMGGMALLGVCIAAVILLPVTSMFLSDSRLGVAQPFRLFIPCLITASSLRPSLSTGILTGSAWD